MFVWLLNLPLRLLLLILLLTKESFLKVISGWRVKFIFFLAYFSGLSFLVCHVQREVRLWRAVCYKIFCFWNLRDFWEKLLIFGILKCSVTTEMYHSNYCNFVRSKCAILGRSKCAIFGRSKCVIFGQSKYLLFGWWKCEFRNSSFRIAIYNVLRILF